MKASSTGATAPGNQGNLGGLGRVWSKAERVASGLLRALDGAAAAPVWARYAGAVAVTGLAAPLELVLARSMGEEVRSLRVTEAVAVLAGVVVGLGPGLAALVAATLFTLVRLPPGPFAVAPTDWVTTGVYFATGLLAIAVAQAWQSARRRSEQAHEAERRACDDLRTEIGRRMRLERQLTAQNDELTHYSHIVAHDLKEPLRGITTLANFLEEELGPRLGPGEFGMLERLKALPVRLAGMVEALLAFAEQRPGDGTVKRPRERVGMVEAAGEAVEVLGPWLSERHAVVDVDPGLPPAHCERALAARVMCNLIANGVKYNRSPRPRVWVGGRAGESRSCAEGTGGSGGVAGGRPCPAFVYCVYDNGIGIAPESRERVFEMFQRLNGRDEFGGGTGAGLALSRRMVERMGGRMWVEDAPPSVQLAEGDGPGAMVCFTLEPDPEDSQPSEPTEALRAPQRAGVPGRTEKWEPGRRGPQDAAGRWWRRLDVAVR